jgi:hypothetical protein
VDTIWDAVHTFLRVPAAAILGFAALSDVAEPWRTGAALLCGTIALSAHGLKAGTRLALNASPEPLTNWAASFSEDALFAFCVWLILFHPALALAAALAVLLAGIVRSTGSFGASGLRFRREPPSAARARPREASVGAGRRRRGRRRAWGLWRFVRLRLRLGSPLTLSPEEPRSPPRPSSCRGSPSPSVSTGTLGPGLGGRAKVEVSETNVGDNVPPPVKTVAWVGYDSRFFYVAFRCDDPDVRKIRAPFVDRDNVYSDQDFAGIILDVKNDRRSAYELFVNARGIQDDAIMNDATGNEDFSPDIFWQSAGRIDATGWQVEMAIPLSSLRYPATDPQTWAINLYRNYPRDFRYQIFSSPLPRGSNCFVCHFGTLEGITGLPRAGHLVAAPYVAGSNAKTYPGSDAYDGAGDNEVTKGKIGMDVKWAPGADTIVDATVNPDFSQIESDVAQISAKRTLRPLLPRGSVRSSSRVDLFRRRSRRSHAHDHLAAVGRSHHGEGRHRHCLHRARHGGPGAGTAILPGPVFSDTAPQDYKSLVALARVRQDLGASFAGFLGTARVIQGGGYNADAGPDFQWRLSSGDVVTGQYLYSVSREPSRPDLSPVWDGQWLSAGAGILT